MTGKALHPPRDVLPPAVASAVDDLPWWFVIGGQAVRCFAPYRRTQDVDFGVGEPRELDDLLSRLESRGRLEVLERTSGTAHVLWEGHRVSIFVLETLMPFSEEKRLTVDGLLATKLHAILDRGTRRDFFDLYVILQTQRLGIAAALRAMHRLHGSKVDDGLLLRALSYFQDAEREGLLPGEGPEDWKTVRSFFLAKVGELIVPPEKPLAIQANIVDLRSGTAATPPAGSSRSRRRGR